MNGGSCSDDHCLCQKGYTGTHCGQRKYAFVNIDTIILGCVDWAAFSTEFQLIFRLVLIRYSGILQENT